MSVAEKVQGFRQEIQRQLPFSANGDQGAAIEKLGRFVLSGDERGVFILRGYAGTGKTNLIAALTRALPSVRFRSVLLAPTGRAAKVLGSYAQRPAQTIHRKIFRKSTGANGEVFFTLSENLHRNTLFIVDEASMIGNDSDASGISSGNVLENLFEYVYSGDNCKIILIGDTAQLPPVGSSESPALSTEFLKSAFHLHIMEAELKEVARQRLESSILENATRLRKVISAEETAPFKMLCGPDLFRIGGEELEDNINSCTRMYGEEGVIIITRSNKRANLFNQSYRQKIKLSETDLNAGDRIMVVKNNYFWLGEGSAEAGFIANGDMAEIKRIIRRESLYKLSFCECQVQFTDYPNLPEQQVRIITDLLYSDLPALSSDDTKALYNEVLADMADEPHRSVRAAYVRKSPYYNALQVKFAYAITCHKAQGGQWPAVFIDHGFLKEEQPDESLLRWLYTAITRSTEKVYLVNFHPMFFDS